MITQETAARIYNLYSEIEGGKMLLEDMDKIRENENLRKYEPTIKDAFGRRQHLQLGIPSGASCHQLLMVSPQLGESIIKAHIAKIESELIEAQEQAKLELFTV